MITYEENKVLFWSVNVVVFSALIVIVIYTRLYITPE